MTDYTKTGNPIQGGRGISKFIRDEFAAIETAVNSKANIDSPALTGTPTAPTATTGDSSTQIATTEFVSNTSFTTNLPAQSGNEDGGLITDGTNASWSNRFVLKDKANTFTAAINTARATVASHATNADIWGASGNEIDFTGTATITDFPDAPQAGSSRVLHISGTPTFTHNANIFIQNEEDYSAEIGDIITVHAITTSTFRLDISRVHQAFLKILPIFDSATSDLVPISSLEDIGQHNYSVGLPSGSINIVYGNGLFVAYTISTSGYVATSADGEIWTLRAMPSSKIWLVGVAGNNFMAIEYGGTAVAVSSDGVTWTLATALPGNTPTNNNNSPVAIGSTWIVNSATSSTCYRSTDHGSSWTTETLPTSNDGGWFYAVGANFLYVDASTNTRISATGQTGSWSGGAGFGNTNIWQNSDGSLGVRNTTTNKIFRSTDGVTWNDVVYENAVNTSNPHFYINGVTGVFSTTNLQTVTFNGYKRVYRSSSINSGPNNRRSSTNASGIHIIGGDGGKVIKITDSITASFI